MKLTKEVAVPYSDFEKALFKLLSTRPKDTTSLVELVYRGHRELPYYANESVTGTLRSLDRKMKINKEKIQLNKTARRGPRPTSYWLEENSEPKKRSKR